jgi:hypothetical protein
MSKSIFLSGWDYNRILREDPLRPSASGLPAQVLWSGSAQFWLFETVYCSKEALEGDMAAYTALGWTTGKIFADLASRGFLTPIDFGSYIKKDDALLTQFTGIHKLLHEHYDRTEIRKYLEEGNDVELEAIKLRLLSPLLRRLQCVKNVSPNSIRHWIAPRRKASQMPAAGTTAAGLFDEALATGGAGSMRASFRLCDPPGTGLPQSVVTEQARIEQQVQRPLIPALLEGSLPMAEFHEALAPTRSYYEPINQQLWDNYLHNIDRLERLRDIAKIHLWPNLHSEWLPSLESDPGYLRKFRSRLRDALLRSRYDPYLQFGTDLAINAVSLGVGAAAGLAAPDFFTGAAAMGMTVYTVRRGLEIVHGEVRKRSDGLTLFLQKAAIKNDGR